MHSENCRRFISDCRFDLFRVDTHRLRIDIHKNRREAVPQQGMGCGDKTVGRRYDLAGNLQSLQRGEECERAVGEQ